MTYPELFSPIWITVFAIVLAREKKADSGERPRANSGSQEGRWSDIVRCVDGEADGSGRSVVGERERGGVARFSDVQIIKPC